MMLVPQQTRVSNYAVKMVPKLILVKMKSRHSIWFSYMTRESAIFAQGIWSVILQCIQGHRIH